MVIPWDSPWWPLQPSRPRRGPQPAASRGTQRRSLPSSDQAAPGTRCGACPAGVDAPAPRPPRPPVSRWRLRPLQPQAVHFAAPPIPLRRCRRGCRPVAGTVVPGGRSAAPSDNGRESPTARNPCRPGRQGHAPCRRVEHAHHWVAALFCTTACASVFPAPTTLLNVVWVYPPPPSAPPLAAPLFLLPRPPQLSPSHPAAQYGSHPEAVHQTPGVSAASSPPPSASAA